MAQVMIDCPKTGRSIYTGWSMEWAGFEATEIGEQTIECPECGETHKWTRQEAYLRADGGG